MSKPNRYGEAAGIALTGARYLLAEKVARRVEDGKPILLDMAMLITADILDGVFLRKFGLDTPARRVADGVVDHLSELRVGLAVAKEHPEVKPYLGILAARAVAVGGLNALHYWKTGEVTKGEWNQKSTNIATAALALTAVNGEPKNTHIAGGIAAGIALATAPAHLKDMGVVHAEGIRKL